IAVHYDAAAQAQVTPRPDVVISTKKGAGYPVGNAGQMGTLHFTNTYFLQSAIKLSGYLFFNEGTAWGTDSLTVSNMDVAFPVNFALTVTSNLTVRDGGNLTLRDAIDGSNSFQARNLMLTNGILSVSNYTGVSFQQDVSVSGAGGALNVWASPLDIGQDLAINGGTMRYSFVSTNPHSLHFGGNLELTNGAALHLYAGPTNSIAGSFHGGLLDLSGKNLVIPTNCVLYPYSNPTNGGSIKMAVNNLTVGAGGSINANGLGYKGGDSRSQYKGYGTGGSAPRGGGGYGGQGGKSGGAPYGTVAGPMYPGSGGGGFSTYAYVGGNAGGLVHVEATGAITLDGKIFVNGLSGDSYCGGGSGGGVLLVCRTFSGNGSIYAKGGHYSNANCGGGGGGRIAIWTKVTGEIYQRVWNGLMPGSVAISTNTLPAAFTGSFGNSVFLDGGLGSATAYNGQPGTFRWLDYSGNGTIIMVH
ncbi:MAG: hypothetical protein GX608_13210, partial [Lentisphaerae bacterium]|nr:hypothetical protein [Lentisphaerota bacterium]